MQNIFWTGYSNDDRLSAISQVQKLVAGFGHVVDVRFFSDISIVLTIEVPEYQLVALHRELSVHLLLEHFDAPASNSERERTVFLNLTFTRATGNLVVEVPSVPG